MVHSYQFNNIQLLGATWAVDCNQEISWRDLDSSVVQSRFLLYMCHSTQPTELGFSSFPSSVNFGAFICCANPISGLSWLQKRALLLVWVGHVSEPNSSPVSGTQFHIPYPVIYFDHSPEPDKCKSVKQVILFLIENYLLFLSLHLHTTCSIAERTETQELN